MQMAKTSLSTNNLLFILLTALGLLCFVLTFFSCSKQGYQLCELLIEVDSLIAEHRSQVQWASVVVAHRYSSCGSWALEHRLSSCGAQALLLCGMWNLPRPGIKPMSPALAGRSLLPVPPCATKIMAYGPITSWQIDGETVETATDFIFGGSKITADGDCSHEIKRCLLLGEKL